MMPPKQRSSSSPAVPGQPGVPLDSPLDKAFGEDSLMTEIDKQRLGAEGYKQVQEDVAAFRQDNEMSDLSTSFIGRHPLPELSRSTSEYSTGSTSTSQSDSDELIHTSTASSQSSSQEASLNTPPTPQNTYAGDESSRTASTSSRQEAVLPFTTSTSSQSSLSQASNRSSQSETGSDFSHIFEGKTASQMAEQPISTKDPDKEEKRMAALDHLSSLIKGMKTVDPQEVKTIRAQIDEFRSTKWLSAGPSKAKATEVRNELEAKIALLNADRAALEVGQFRDQLKQMSLTGMTTVAYGHLDKEAARMQGLAELSERLVAAQQSQSAIGEEFERAIMHFQPKKTGKDSHSQAATLLGQVRSLRNEQALNEARAAHARTLKEMGGMGAEELATVTIPKDHTEKHDVRMAGLERLQVLLPSEAMSKDRAAKYLAAADHFKSRSDKDVQKTLAALKKQIKDQAATQKPLARQIKTVGLEAANLQAKTAEELSRVTVPYSSDKDDSRAWKDTMQTEIRSRLSGLKTITADERQHYYTAILNCTSKHYNPVTKGNREKLEKMLNRIPVQG